MYRVGGRYDREIRRIVGASRRCAAVRAAGDGGGAAALIRFYETGEDADRIAYDIAWVARSGVAGRHDQRLRRGLHGPARRRRARGRAIVCYVNPEKTRQHPDAGRARAVVRGSHAVGSAVPESRRCTGVTAQRHRRRDRDRRLRPGDADRHQPAERSGDSRAVRQQVGVAVQRQTRRTSNRRPTGCAREFSWDADEAARPRRWGAFAQELTTDMHEVIGHGSGRMADERHGAAASAAQGAVLGDRGVARRSRRAVFPPRPEARGARPRVGRGSRRRSCGRSTRHYTRNRARAAAARP